MDIRVCGGGGPGLAEFQLSLFSCSTIERSIRSPLGSCSMQQPEERSDDSSPPSTNTRVEKTKHTHTHTQTHLRQGLRALQPEQHAEVSAITVRELPVPPPPPSPPRTPFRGFPRAIGEFSRAPPLAGSNRLRCPRFWPRPPPLLLLLLLPRLSVLQMRPHRQCRLPR